MQGSQPKQKFIYLFVAYLTILLVTQAVLRRILWLLNNKYEII
jgi:hypothetical protein